MFKRARMSTSIHQLLNSLVPISIFCIIWGGFGLYTIVGGIVVYRFRGFGRSKATKLIWTCVIFFPSSIGYLNRMEFQTFQRNSRSHFSCFPLQHSNIRIYLGIGGLHLFSLRWTSCYCNMYLHLSIYKIVFSI